MILCAARFSTLRPFAECASSIRSNLRSATGRVSSTDTRNVPGNPFFVSAKVIVVVDVALAIEDKVEVIDRPDFPQSADSARHEEPFSRVVYIARNDFRLKDDPVSESLLSKVESRCSLPPRLNIGNSDFYCKSSLWDFHNISMGRGTSSMRCEKSDAMPRCSSAANLRIFLVEAN